MRNRRFNTDLEEETSEDPHEIEPDTGRHLEQRVEEPRFQGRHGRDYREQQAGREDYGQSEAEGYGDRRTCGSEVEDMEKQFGPYGPRTGYGESESSGRETELPDYPTRRGYGSYAQDLGSQFGQYGQRSVQGRFAGSGPRAYGRADHRMQEDINDRLAIHPDLDPSEIEVIVQNGEVTLKGTIDEQWAKRLTEDIAKSVFGVKEVNNQMQVRRQSERDGSD